ncbi:hypothetical protein AMTRI_Chr03g49400 [Amborella trichopoda]
MLKKKLEVWNKNIFGNELQEMVGTNFMIDEDELMVKTKVHNALAIQEKFWASKNFIRFLKTESNQELGELGDLNSIGSYCAEFYKKNLKAKGCSTNNDLFNLIPNMVNLADNNFLEVVPSPLEIKDIVFRMDAFSSPGTYGLGGFFCKHCWDIVKYDVCRDVRSFFIDGCIPNGYNNNFITLVPKEQGADTLSKFRPICMGNFIFKIIPKILADMLRVIAPKLISEKQGTFLKGRQISSNNCMASELLNSFPKKTYDSLEWPFLLEVLRRFGFIVKFMSWVKKILHSANISILVERGLRQDDPLAPLLFILKMICTLKGPRVSIGYLPFKYLGVPIFLGTPKAILLRPLLERICNNLSGWKGKILISWDKVCKPINESGLGLRRLRDVNFSNLMKLAWNFIFAKYFKEDTSDVWVKNTSLTSQSSHPLSAFQNSKTRVSHFISGNPQTWCSPMVNFTLLNEFLRAAFGIDLPYAPIPDQRIWKHTISVANNAIIIDEKIKSIGIPLVSCFPLCGNSMETRDNLFVTCFFANNMWSWSTFGSILRDSSGVLLGSFSGPIPMGTNYSAELNAVIYSAEYVIRKFLIATGHAVGGNIGNFVLHYLIAM